MRRALAGLVRGARGRVVAALGLAWLSLAPVAGDIGSCGEAPDELDPVKFFTLKSSVDCLRCRACKLDTERCRAACAGEREADEFDAACRPLAHDGEVCLRALQSSGCGDFAGYVADQGATVPSECDFCPLGAPGSPGVPQAPVGDAGGGGP